MRRIVEREPRLTRNVDFVQEDVQTASAVE